MICFRLQPTHPNRQNSHFKLSAANLMTTRRWKPIYVKTNKTVKKPRAERSRNKYKSILLGWMVSGRKFKRLKWLRSKENTIKSTGNPWIVLVIPELQKGFQMINPHRYLPLALLGRPALPTIKKDMNQWHLLKWRNINCTFSNKIVNLISSLFEG